MAGVCCQPFSSCLPSLFGSGVATMNPSSLIIRNVTTNPIELKIVERFEAAQSDNGGIVSNLTRKLSGQWSNATSPTASQIALKAETFRTEDITIPVAPFETRSTDIQPGLNQILRLTFEADGQRYRVDTPTPTQRSTVLTPLSPDPHFEFTAVYLAASSHLTIYSSAKLESWMSKFRNETPLSAFSIPGTHNSATHHTALPSVRCQAVSVREQLDNGVRFLDVRVQPESSSDSSKDRLILVHSAFPVSLTGSKYFRDLVNVVLSFLNDNPSETVMISVKREGVGKATDQLLSKILFDHYATDSTRWFTENRIPVLGEARDKIVLIRRFALDPSLKTLNNGSGFCIDAESWPDNCADGLCSSGEIRVQDFYEVAEHTNIGKKISYCSQHLDRAAEAICHLPGELEASNVEAAQQPFFFNFLSASNFWRTNCWPEKIAAKINPSIIDYLCRQHNESRVMVVQDGNTARKVGDGSTGVVVCDWVGFNGDWDLVRCIVGHNAKLELRERP